MLKDEEKKKAEVEETHIEWPRARMFVLCAAAHMSQQCIALVTCAFTHFHPTILDSQSITTACLEHTFAFNSQVETC